MNTWINKSNTSTKHMSYKCKCIFDVIKCNSNEKWNNDRVNVSVKIWRKSEIIYAKDIILGILLHVAAKIANM